MAMCFGFVCIIMKTIIHRNRYILLVSFGYHQPGATTDVLPPLSAQIEAAKAWFKAANPRFCRQGNATPGSGLNAIVVRYNI